MAAFMAMDSRADHSPYEQNSLAISEANLPPDFPDGVRKK